MRPQQRSFVVEFKNRSRQSKATKPVSIWGDTDLKAVARQVEEQSPHIFPPSDTAATMADTVSVEVTPSTARTPDVDCPDVQTSIDPPSTGDTARAEPLTVAPVKHVIVQSDPAPSIVPVRRKKPQRTKAPVRKAAKSRNVIARSQAAADVLPLTASATSRADIADLIKENTQLKEALRAQITAENNLLKNMLTRLI